MKKILLLTLASLLLAPCSVLPAPCSVLRAPPAPPYGREIAAWTRKAAYEVSRGALVVGLLPASADLRWWHEDVLPSAAELRFIRGRVRFITEGPYRASGFFASVVVVWRPFGRKLTELGPISMAMEANCL